MAFLAPACVLGISSEIRNRQVFASLDLARKMAEVKRSNVVIRRWATAAAHDFGTCFQTMSLVVDTLSDYHVPKPILAPLGASLRNAIHLRSMMLVEAKLAAGMPIRPSQQTFNM